jgi:hypothetical protein
MNCDRASENISAYLDGELPPEEAAEVRAHLDDCPVCLAAERDLRALRGLLGSLPERAAPTELADQVQRHVAEPGSGRQRPDGTAAGGRHVRRSVSRVLALAATLVLAVGVGVLAWLGTWGTATRDVSLSRLPSEGAGVGEPTKLAEALPDGAELRKGGAAFEYADKGVDDADRRADLHAGDPALQLTFADKIGPVSEAEREPEERLARTKGWQAEQEAFGISDPERGLVAGEDVDELSEGEYKVGGESLTGDKLAYYDPARPHDAEFELGEDAVANAPLAAQPPAPAAAPAPTEVGADGARTLFEDRTEETRTPESTAMAREPAADLAERAPAGADEDEDGLLVGGLRTAKSDKRASKDAPVGNTVVNDLNGVASEEVSDESAAGRRTLVLETAAVEKTVDRLAAVLRASGLIHAGPEERTGDSYRTYEDVEEVGELERDAAPGQGGTFTVLDRGGEPGYVVVADAEQIDRVVAALQSLEAARDIVVRWRGEVAAQSTLGVAMKESQRRERPEPAGEKAPDARPARSMDGTGGAGAAPGAGGAAETPAQPAEQNGRRQSEETGAVPADLDAQDTHATGLTEEPAPPPEDLEKQRAESRRTGIARDQGGNEGRKRRLSVLVIRVRRTPAVDVAAEEVPEAPTSAESLRSETGEREAESPDSRPADTSEALE